MQDKHPAFVLSFLSRADLPVRCQMAYDGKERSLAMTQEWLGLGRELQRVSRAVCGLGGSHQRLLGSGEKV